ncbi:MAG: neuraminidase-like domain-containing protein, partial [Bacteroidota bacterium]
SLRPDKTRLFKSLEDELLQQELSKEAVEKAYINYFQAFHKLAALEHIAACQHKIKQPTSPKAVTTFFNFARTNLVPREFYYQIAYHIDQDQPEWQEWHKIDLPIQSEALTPIYYFDKLFVFWVEHEERETSGKKEHFFTIKYAWQELNGLWSDVQTLMEKTKFKNYDKSIGQRVDVLIDSIKEVIKVRFCEKDQQHNFELNRCSEVKIRPVKDIPKDTISKLTDDRTNPMLSTARRNMATAIIKDFILFAGGFSDEGQPELHDTIDFFKIEDNGSCERKTYKVTEDEKEIVLGLKRRRRDLSAAVVDKFVLFAGGKQSDGCTDLIDIFECDDNKFKLSKKSLSLSTKRKDMVSAAIGDYVMFAGGQNNDDKKNVTYSESIDIFKCNDSSLSMYSHKLKLSVARDGLTAAVIGNYVLFAGGAGKEGCCDIIDVFMLDSNNEIVPCDEFKIALSERKKSLASAVIGNYVLFAGGFNESKEGEYQRYDTIDVFRLDHDGKLSKHVNPNSHPMKLSVPRSGLTAAVVGDFVLFAGGNTNSFTSDHIDLFYVNNHDRCIYCHGAGTLKRPQKGMLSGVLHDRIYLAGGTNEEDNPDQEIDVLNLSDVKCITQNGKGILAVDIQLQAEAQQRYFLPESRENVSGDITILSNVSSKKVYTTLNASNQVSLTTENYAGYLLQFDLPEVILFSNTINDYADTQNKLIHRLSTQLSGKLLKKLKMEGIGGLLSLESQRLKESNFALLKPNSDLIKEKNYPRAQLDFQGNYGIYYQELFCHIPLMVAKRLQEEGKHREAQQWYHYVFDPTIKQHGKDEPYWRYLPFRDQETKPLEKLLKENKGIEAYNNDPFSPYAIASTRNTAFQKNVVMQYIDNLLAWGDACFVKDTWEDIAEATMLYFIAWNVMGPKPESVGEWKAPAEKDYTQLKVVSQFLISVENSITDEQSVTSSSLPPPINELNAYFGVMHNSKLNSYWDKVEDRLYKIRHSMNIKGVFRALSLYEPAIDPMQLVRAVANGQSPSQFLAERHTDILPYRFEHLLERAKSLTSNVIQLGGALLSALEKQDAEKLSVIRQSHERNNLNMIATTKKNQIESSKASLASLQETLKAAEKRRAHYDQLIKNGLNGWEITSAVAAKSAQVSTIVSNSFKTAAALARIVPNVIGASNGGSDYGAVPTAGAHQSDIVTSSSALVESLASTTGSYQRRAEDWKFQRSNAEQEIAQIQKQMEGQEIQLKITEQELKIHEESMKQSQEIDDYMQRKFTNEALYSWQVSQLSSVYFQSYKLAQQTALAAEKAYQFELNKEDTFISFEHWNSLKKGLLSGESLLLDIGHLEKAYITNNDRLLEIEKVISLKQHLSDDNDNSFQKQMDEIIKNPKEKLLRFELTKDLFDDDFDNHYNRRIKSISITIPAVVGPYENIYATLYQTSNIILPKPGMTQESEGVLPDYRGKQSIALSRGINDAGVFELNFNDARYLPFEGTGVVSKWTLKFSGAKTNKDILPSISDIIIHLKYTAQQ